MASIISLEKRFLGALLDLSMRLYTLSPCYSQEVSVQRRKFMSEADQLRSIPLAQVLSLLGVTTQWKRRANEEYYGPCPLHESKKNQTSFSFKDSVFHCFSCEGK